MRLLILRESKIYARTGDIIMQISSVIYLWKLLLKCHYEREHVMTDIFRTRAGAEMKVSTFGEQGKTDR